jgi:hypothetical protein
MDENKMSEADVIKFCVFKGMKNLPEYVGDFSEKLKDRLVNNFSEVIAHSLKK